ncbi:MAG TPA: hypothetical protein VF407_12810 [Polyangiaceae bacterium]
MKRVSLWIGLFSGAFAIVGADARAADDTTNRCVDAHHAAQTDRRNAQLVRARGELVTCAQDTCPALIASDCKRWLAEVGDRIPTVVVTVPNASDATPATLALTLDGRALDADAIGRAIEVDPGRHVVHAEAGSFVGETSVVAAEGTRDTAVAITLHDRRVVVASEPPPSTSIYKRSLVPFVVGGIGIVGLGVASGFGIAGISERSHLESEACAPNCNHDDVSTVRRNFAIADVALGVSIVALATAVVLYVVDSPKTSTENARASFTFRF